MQAQVPLCLVAQSQISHFYMDENAKPSLWLTCPSHLVSHQFDTYIDNIRS
jgi:hypothetical protein